MGDNDSLVQRCYFLNFITEDIDQVKHIYIMAGSLDAILILPTIVLNILLIISLYWSPQLNKPCTKLLYSLAISDVLVGMVIEPVYLTKKIAELQHSFGMYCRSGMIMYLLGGALGSVSFFTLTAIAVDRYLVVHSGTKYRTIVTNTRVVWIIIAIWVTSGCLYSTNLFLPKSFCFRLAASVMVSCVVITTFCYVKGFLTLRNQKRKVQNCLNNDIKGQPSTNTRRYEKSMYTMLYIFLAFNLCYLPYLCTAVSVGILGESAAIWGAESLSVVLIFTNSLINPIILFWRMKEIQNAVTTTVVMIYSRSSHFVIQDTSHAGNHE
ncbi:histamine H2 receptor-like [Actinia tenebrosa]|uniref:Histamine H2 receptor-like n=1 Tax=Actinia tenebrosa TaxID=6105 RepID=A0A6P8I8B2_ACTTE|nr:histamine H2 receptor-like [Actinia tenebrosa]